MSRPLRDYRAYGLWVRSAIALPFVPVPVPPAREPEVTVRIGATAEALPTPADKRGLWETAPGAFLMDVPGIARYLVTDGRDILVEPHGGSDHDAGVFLTGSMFSALLQQRGVTTFHASAIETDSGAVLFAGRSGSGKSSLLAALRAGRRPSGRRYERDETAGSMTAIAGCIGSGPDVPAVLAAMLEAATGYGAAGSLTKMPLAHRTRLYQWIFSDLTLGWPPSRPAARAWPQGPSRRLVAGTPVMSVHLRWHCRSGAAYNPGMEDTETLTITPSGSGRSLVDEPPAAPAPSPSAALPPEPPASPPPSAAESPAFSPPAELLLSELEFTGCKAVPMTYAQLRRYDGRLEVWDAESETAWMVREPTSPTHESPSHGLAGLVALIAAVRGSSIKCYGSMDLLMRDARGEPRRIMQADQTVYLYPRRAELLGASAMVVGRHNYPDVVLEVDHTTDVRRGKLKLYESWGFPEVWVEVPEQWVASRPRGLGPGLTIHLLEDGVYRASPESVAFPGWRAEAIHEAMNEAERSVRTNERLERLGRGLGTRDGTGPDDDALLRSLRGQSRAEGEHKGRAEGEKKGRTKGLAEGRRKGRAEGQAEDRVEMVREMLRARGIAFSESFPANVPGFAESSRAVVVAAALGCDSERDFHARIASGSGPRR